MIILTLIYTHDDIFKSVKEDSSYIAEREDPAMFDKLVFDEEYLIKFKRMFLEAQTKIVEKCIAYIKDTPVEARYIDNQNYDTNKDFFMNLYMPDNFIQHTQQILDTRIRQYLINYILYLWLKDKHPNISQMLYAETVVLLDGIAHILNMRKTITRTTNRMF